VEGSERWGSGDASLSPLLRRLLPTVGGGHPWLVSHWGRFEYLARSTMLGDGQQQHGPQSGSKKLMTSRRVGHQWGPHATRWGQRAGGT